MTYDQQPDDDWEWESPERRRPQRLEEETAEVGFPIVWVLIGGLAGLLTIGLIGLGVVQFINKRSAPTATPSGLPTLALPASPTAAEEVVVEADTPTPAPAAPTPTPVPPTAEVVSPTDTPEPEPVAPTEIEEGGHVQIVNTEGAGLSLRAGPGTNNARLVVAEADAILPVIGGPNEDEDGQTDEDGNPYVWWFLRNADGTEGWGRADFLAPSPPPE
jgi:hypothetical protein